MRKLEKRHPRTIRSALEAHEALQRAHALNQSLAPSALSLASAAGRDAPRTNTQFTPLPYLHLINSYCPEHSLSLDLAHDCGAI